MKRACSICICITSRTWRMVKIQVRANTKTSDLPLHCYTDHDIDTIYTQYTCMQKLQLHICIVAYLQNNSKINNGR